MDESGENPTPHHSTLSKLDDDFCDIAQHHILSVAGKQSYYCERFEPRSHFIWRWSMIIQIWVSPEQDCSCWGLRSPTIMLHPLTKSHTIAVFRPTLQCFYRWLDGRFLTIIFYDYHWYCLTFWNTNKKASFQTLFLMYFLRRWW